MTSTVLIGKLIPAGTGMKRYRNVKLDTDAAIPTGDIDLDYEDEDDESEEVYTDDILVEEDTEE